MRRAHSALAAASAWVPVRAGLRGCVKRQEATCRASRPRCWVAPTAYLRSAAAALAALLPPQTGRRDGGGHPVKRRSNAVGGRQWGDADGGTSGGSAGSAPAAQGWGRVRPGGHDAEELAFLCRSLRMDALPAAAQRHRSPWGRLLRRRAAPAVVLFGGGALAPDEVAGVRQAALVVRFDGSDPGCGPSPTRNSKTAGCGDDVGAVVRKHASWHQRRILVVNSADSRYSRAPRSRAVPLCSWCPWPGTRATDREMSAIWRAVRLSGGTVS